MIMIDNDEEINREEEIIEIIKNKDLKEIKEILNRNDIIIKKIELLKKCCIIFN